MFWIILLTFIWVIYALMFDPLTLIDQVCWLREMFVGVGCVDDL